MGIIREKSVLPMPGFVSYNKSPSGLLFHDCLLDNSTSLNSCLLWRISKEKRLELEQLVPLPICFDVIFIPFLLFSFLFFFSFFFCIQNIPRSITEFLSTCILTQCEPNAKNEIYKWLRESAEASHQHIIVRNELALLRMIFDKFPTASHVVIWEPWPAVDLNFMRQRPWLRTLRLALKITER